MSDMTRDDPKIIELIRYWLSPYGHLRECGTPTVGQVAEMRQALAEYDAGAADATEEAALRERIAELQISEPMGWRHSKVFQEERDEARAELERRVAEHDRLRGALEREAALCDLSPSPHVWDVGKKLRAALAEDAETPVVDPLNEARELIRDLMDSEPETYNHAMRRAAAWLERVRPADTTGARVGGWLPVNSELVTTVINACRAWGPWDSGNPDHIAGALPMDVIYNAAVRACRDGLIPKVPVAPPPANVDRSHEECVGCRHETTEPPVCSGHVAGPVHCGLFEPKAASGRKEKHPEWLAGARYIAFIANDQSGPSEYMDGDRALAKANIIPTEAVRRRPEQALQREREWWAQKLGAEATGGMTLDQQQELRQAIIVADEIVNQMLRPTTGHERQIREASMMARNWMRSRPVPVPEPSQEGESDAQ